MFFLKLVIRYLLILRQTYPAEPHVEDVGYYVLGGGDVDVWQRWNLPELGEAGPKLIYRALELYRKHPKSIIVFTGGSGDLRDAFNSNKSESALAQEFFFVQGINPTVDLEPDSNTAENAEPSLRS